MQRVSYADDMISGQMIAGLFNTDHQSRVMAEAATFTTLQQKLHKLISLESTSHLHSQPQSVLSAAHKSFYKQPQRNTEETRLRERKHDLVNVKPCNGCGKTNHPRNKSMSRKDCPAINMNCLNCGIKGHLKSVCLQPHGRRNQESSNNATQVGGNPQQDSYVF